MRKCIATALVVLAVVACWAAPCVAAVRSLDIGLADTRNCSIDKGQVAWEGSDAGVWQVFLFDGIQILQLTHAVIQNRNSMVRGGRVIWEGEVGGKWQVFLYNGYDVTQLTSTSNHRNSRLDDSGNAIWEGYDGAHWQVYLYKGNTTTQISNGRVSCSHAAINQGKVVWLAPNAKHKNQVFLYDGASVRQLTTVVTQGSTVHDYTQGATAPDIYGDQVVWQGLDHRLWNIYLYRQGAVRCISESKLYVIYDDRRPHIWDGKVVWESKAGDDWDINFYNGTSNTRWTHAQGNDLRPVIRNGRTCWLSITGAVKSVMLKDGSNVYGGQSYLVSDGKSRTDCASIDEWGRVCWRQLVGGRHVIMLFDGTRPLGLGLLPWDHTVPSVHNGQIAWQGVTMIGNVPYQEVYLWDGTTTRTLTSDTYDNESPDINNGTVCWLKKAGGVEQVFVWRDGLALPVTDSTPVKQNPKVYGDQVIWQQYVGTNQGIYSCPVPTLVHLTDDGLDHQDPQFEHGLACWSRGTGSGREIDYWDGSALIPLTSNGYEDRNPRLRAGRVVWEGCSNGYWQIFMYDGAAVLQLTNAAYDNINARLDADGRVVWQGRANGNWQIFKYDGGVISQLTNTSGLDNTDPAIDGGEVFWRGQFTWMSSTKWQIYRWKNGASARLTLSPYDNSKPEVSGGHAVWLCSNGQSQQVIYWDGGQVEPALTHAFYDCSNIQLAGNLIVWQQNESLTNSEIYYYRTDRPGVTRLTSNLVNDVSPRTDGTHITWASQEDGKWKVYLSDCNSAVMVTSAATNNSNPRVSDMQLIWLESVNGTSQVRGWFPRQTLLSNPAYESVMPVITSGGYVAWEAYDGANWRVCRWNGAQAEVFSPAGYDAHTPAVDGDEMVWEEFDGQRWQIKYYDGSTIRALTSGSFDSLQPQIDQHRVVWAGFDGADYEIFLFDGTSTYQLTDNDTDDVHPHIHSGQVVWESRADGGRNIMFWDGAAVHTVTTNDMSDTNARIHMGLVTWQGWTGYRWQVYAWKWQGRPLFVPIGDKSVDIGQTLEFEVSAVDPNGDPLTYSVSGLPAGATFDQVSHVFGWTPTYDQAGVYHVFFTASDQNTPPESTTEGITITVGYVNFPPTINPVPDVVVRAGSPVNFSLSGSDPNHEGLTFSAQNLPDGAGFDAPTATFSWVPAENQTGDWTVIFTATDAGTPPLSDSIQVKITVGNNNPPVLEPIGNKIVAEGNTLSFVVTATDPENNNLTYSATNLPPGAGFNPDTRLFSWTPAYNSAGTYAGVRFTVGDDGVPAAQTHEDITITVLPRDAAPVIAPIGDQTVNTNEMLRFTVGGSDPDGDDLIYEAINLPRDPVAPYSNATFYPSTHIFEWRPDASCVGTWSNVTFKVTEVQPNKLTNSSFNASTSIAPWAVSGTPASSPTSGGYGDNGSYLQWSSAAGGTYAYQRINSPPPVGTPLVISYAFLGASDVSSQAGLYNVTDNRWVGGTPSVVAGNGAWQVASQQVTLAAQDAGDILEVRLYGNGATAYDEVHCAQPGLPETELLANNGFVLVQSIYPWVVTGTPANVLNNNGYPTGGNCLQWTDAAPGTYAGQAIANPPAAGSQITLSYAFKADAAYSSQAGLFNATDATWVGGAPSVVAGSGAWQLVQQTVTVQDQDEGDVLEVRLYGTGTVAYDNAECRLPALSTTQSINITVNLLNAAPTLSPIGDKAVNWGQTLTFTVRGNDADNNNMSFVCDPLPPGATFTPDPANPTTAAIFTWTPTLDQVGQYPVTFRATDDGTPPMSGQQPVTITVGDNHAPSIAAVGDRTAQQGDLLQFSVTGSDPDGDVIDWSAYLWANNQKFQLPAGASFNAATGVFTWRPSYTQQGVFQTITFQATDRGVPSMSSTVGISVTVYYVNMPPVFDQIGNDWHVVHDQMSGKVGQQIQFSVEATDPNNEQVTYGAHNLPPGAGFDPSTRLFTWTPTAGQDGVYAGVTFMATDNGSPPRATAHTITITISP